MMLVDDQRLTFVEGTVRRSIGPALVEVGVAREMSGGMAARAQILGKIGPVNVNAEALLANDFHLHGGRAESLRDVRLALDAPIKLGRTVLPAHADVRYVRSRGTGPGSSTPRRGCRRISTGSTSPPSVRYRKQYLASGSAPPAELSSSTSSAAAASATSACAARSSFDVAPSARFRSAELSAYWSASDTVDWEGGLLYDAASKQRAARGSRHIRRLNSMAIAVTGEAATDGSLALGLNLNFSLDPRRRLQRCRGGRWPRPASVQRTRLSRPQRQWRRAIRPSRSRRAR